VAEIADRPGRAIRTLGWIWRAFWLTLFLLLLGHYLVSSAADRRLERELADRRQAGELPSVEGLIPRLPSGAANAADSYQRAFGALALSRDQGALLLGEGDFLWWNSPKPPREWNARELAVARAAVARNTTYFQLLDKASAIPDCAFRVGWHRGHMTSLPQLPGLLWAGLMLRARAVVLTTQGKPEQALASCGAALRIADHVQREPALISQHIGYCLQESAVDGIEHVLRGSQVTPAAATLRSSEAPSLRSTSCQRLADQLGAVDLVPRSLWAMKGEQAIYGLPTFDSQRSLLPAELPPPHQHPPLLSRLAPGLTLTLDELSYLDYSTQASRALALPWPAAERLAGQADQQVERLPYYRGLVTKWVAPPVLPELLHRQETMARLGDAQIALALRLHRLQHERYPDSLAALGTVSGELPADPFDQQPYHYRRQGAGFVVYSVGPDMKDDGGRPRSGEEFQGLLQEQPPDPQQRYDIPFCCDH
jgi:hypothetical protein